jgi:hypothetical protein
MVPIRSSVSDYHVYGAGVVAAVAVALGAGVAGAFALGAGVAGAVALDAGADGVGVLGAGAAGADVAGGAAAANADPVIVKLLLTAAVSGPEVAVSV